MPDMRSRMVRILRWSESYTKTDMVYLASSGFWLTAGQVASSLASLVLTIVFANLLPREVFGEYRYILSVVALLQIPTLDDMDFAVRRAAARGIDGALVAGLHAKLKWGSLGGIASLGIALYYLLAGANELALAFLIASMFLPFVDSLSLYLGYLEGKTLFMSSSIQRAAAQIISVITLAITACTSPSLIALLIAYFVPLTVVRLFGHIYTIRTRRIRDTEESEAEVRYGIHLSVIGTFNSVVSDNLNRILIWHAVGPVAVAAYSLAYSPVIQIRMLINNIFSIGLPRFAVRPISEIRRGILAKMARLFVGIALVVATYIALAPEIFRIFFSAYTDAVPYTQLLAVILLFLPKSLINTVFIAHARKKELYTWNMVGNVAQVVFLIVMLPLWGMYGVILAQILTQLVTMVTLIYLLWRIRD